MKKRCLILFHIFLFWFGCAYFNTFYNASQFYREAELDISAVNEDGLSESAIDLLNKTIIRCNTVISDHPESRFVDDAILLRSKAQYHLGQLSGALNSIRILEIASHTENNKVLENYTHKSLSRTSLILLALSVAYKIL